MEKDQLFIATTSSHFPEKAFEYAKKVAEAYEKEICIISLDENKNIVDVATKYQEQTSVKINVIEENVSANFAYTLEKAEASMVVFEISNNKPFNNISYLLKLCRDLRIPYIFVKEDFEEIKFNKVIVPISFLVEEKEKGPFSSGFGRYLKSEIILMPANDYGSKARNNCNAIIKLLEKFELNFQEVKAKGDSYKVELEAVKAAKQYDADIAIITASRDYGLDDIIFGPKELHILKQTEIPVMLLNPRGDLYVLCG
jgi:nucleotide-binding universal stress UspA family protein